MPTKLLPAFVIASLIGLASQEPVINARDAFFSAADMVAVSKKSNAAKPQRSAKAAPAPKPSASKPDPGRASGPRPEIALATPPPTVPVPADSEAHFRLASNSSAPPARPLGLRYSLLKKAPAGLAEVPTSADFHAGDSIRLSVMGNQSGYLYVIARGTSGLWSPLFPHPESAQQANAIVPGRVYQIPGGPGEYFTFDEQAGEEKLFLIFSAKPVNDLEELIQLLAGKGPSIADRPARPARPSSLEATNRFNDAWVAQLRSQVQSRDLVFTRIDKPAAEAPISQNAPSASDFEQATYVVNTAPPDLASAGRVVVDLSLRHK